MMFSRVRTISWKKYQLSIQSVQQDNAHVHKLLRYRVGIEADQGVIADSLERHDGEKL
jgi:hypothetical protein